MREEVMAIKFVLVPSPFPNFAGRTALKTFDRHQSQLSIFLFFERMACLPWWSSGRVSGQLIEGLQFKPP